MMCRHKVMANGCFDCLRAERDALKAAGSVDLVDALTAALDRIGFALERILGALQR